MLDQNTDRMWFVIGAVIVGAAIIFIANGTLPEVFASVTETFKGASGDATEIVDSMQPNVGYLNDGRQEYESKKPVGFNETNLFNLSTVRYGMHIHHNENMARAGGATNKNAEWAMSDYISIDGNTSYTFAAESSSLFKKIIFFDVDKKFIKGYADNPAKYSTKTSPSNARYAVIATVYSDVNGTELYSPVFHWWFGETKDQPSL